MASLPSRPDGPASAPGPRTGVRSSEKTPGIAGALVSVAGSPQPHWGAHLSARPRGCVPPPAPESKETFHRHAERIRPEAVTGGRWGDQNDAALPSGLKRARTWAVRKAVTDRKKITPTAAPPEATARAPRLPGGHALRVEVTLHAPVRTASGGSRRQCVFLA